MRSHEFINENSEFADIDATSKRMYDRYNRLKYGPYERATDHAFSYDRGTPGRDYWDKVAAEIKKLIASNENLNELKTISSGRYDTVVSKMSSDGYYQLGKGSYSTVFQHPDQPNTVVKVFFNDRGYSEYLRWMWANQSNKYVPKIVPYPDGDIIKVYKFRDLKYGELIGKVNLRKLNPITDLSVIYKFAEYVISYLGDTASKMIDPSVYGVDPLSKLYYLHTAQWYMIANNSREADSDLSELSTEFVRMSKKFGRLDLHNENLMVDPNTNQIVFIDVLADNRKVK